MYHYTFKNMLGIACTYLQESKQKFWAFSLCTIKKDGIFLSGTKKFGLI